MSDGDPILSDEAITVSDHLVQEMSDVTTIVDKQHQQAVADASACGTDSQVALIQAKANLQKVQLLTYAVGFVGFFAIVMAVFSGWLFIFPEIYGHEPDVSENALQMLLYIRDIIASFVKVLL